jgi:hypothetical protein
MTTLTHTIPGYAEKGWPNDRDLPAIGTLPPYLVDEHKHDDVLVILDVRSGLHVGYFLSRDDAENTLRYLRIDWPSAVFVTFNLPASEPWYVEPENVRLDDHNMTRIYRHPPMREIEGLNLDLVKYQRMQTKLLRFFEKRPAKPPTWRHLKWIAGPTDAAGSVPVVIEDPDTGVKETLTTGVSPEFFMCFGYLYNNHFIERPEK